MAKADCHFIRGYAAAHCGKASPDRLGLSFDGGCAPRLPEAQPQEEMKEVITRKAAGFTHCAAAKPPSSRLRTFDACVRMSLLAFSFGGQIT